ncbi:MAG TPA: hypothetical protein VIR79_05860, partial [Nitrospira sp.]
YVRKKETIVEAFAYLDKLQREGILSREVMGALRELSAAGAFDAIIAEARGHRLTAKEKQLLRRMES